MPPAAANPATAPRSSRSAWIEALLGRMLGRPMYAVAVLTLRAAVRYRFVQVLLVLLLAAALGLPSIIKHDGSAQGFTQILLTYTLGAITVLLGFATLWLGCGSLARDVEECQMQMVAVKPIARWQVWLGKWLGIMALNAGLLAVAGGAVYGLLQWRAASLPPSVREDLQQKILVARGSVREHVDYAAIDREVEAQFQERIKDQAIAALDRTLVRTQLVEMVKAQFQIVPSGNVRRWALNLGLRADSLRHQPLALRAKFFSAQGSSSGTFDGFWEIGPIDGRRVRLEPMSLAPETFHEFPIPPGLIDDRGFVMVDFFNFNNTALLFPLEEGLELLYPEAGFGLNFARGLVIILCWMGLLAALGLAAGSFLSFPVASFCALALLIIAFSTGTIRQVIEEGGVSGVNSNTGQVDSPALIDQVAVPLFKGLLWVINLARDFSPIDSLSSGRSISWGQVAQAVSQIILLMGGLFAILGISTFTRRELATAQSP